jgi:hypothetical protein
MSKRTWQEALMIEDDVLSSEEQTMREITIDGITYDLVKKDRISWRMPNIKELLSTVDYEKYDPATSMEGFTPSFYWSSSSNVSDSKSAWGVYFKYGGSHYGNKTVEFYVRCVRTDENGNLVWGKSSDKPMTWEAAKVWCEKQ